MSNLENNGYLPDEFNYDELINNAGWPSVGGQQQYSNSQPHQEHYTRYQTSQPQYDHFPELSELSYPQIPYSNSPYVSQYQNTGTPGFVSGPYVDPSLQSSRAGYGALNSSFSFQPNTSSDNATISPQSLQYGRQQQPMNPSAPNTTFQRSTNLPPQQNYLQMPSGRSGQYISNQADRNVQSNAGNPAQYLNMAQTSSGSGPSQDPRRSVPIVLISPIKPQAQQPYMRFTNQALFDNKDSSSRPRLPHAPFIAWEDTPIRHDFPKTTQIEYRQRKSRSGQYAIPDYDLTQFQTAAKPKRGRPPKEPGAPKAPYKGKAVAGKVNSLRDGSRNSPSTPTESESSEEESESESESEYEEDMPVVDISAVRGSTRPSNRIHAAAWDTVGIVWKDPYSNPHPDVIKEAIEKFGDFIIAQRNDMKVNTAKYLETTKASGRVVEELKLKDERVELLEVLYSTINAATIHGFEPIIENLGSHQKLVLALSSILIDCTKADDYVGKLPKIVLKFLTKFKNLTDGLLKKVKFDKIQERWLKKGDDESNGYITTILSNTVEAKEKAAKSKKGEEDPKLRQQIEDTKKQRAAAAPAPVTNSAKRPNEGEGTNGKPLKKFASDVGGTPTPTVVKPPIVKRTTNNLLGISTKAPPRPAVKKPEEKKPEPPTESRLGALLASIGKAPEKPKAPVAPNRPLETPEEKARRERKESRRHLRVKFRPDDQLTEIRLFKHEQAEDEGRQDEMLKDAHDDRLEGMMHKKRVAEADTIMDEDEDYQPPEVEVPYTEPLSIDFSALDKTTRFGPTYVTRGGDLPVETEQQKKQAQREGMELMVVYTDDKDIPPTPKEPTRVVDEYQPELRLKQPTEPWLVQRVQEIQKLGPEHASRVFLSRREEQMFKEIRENRARDVANSFSPPNTTSKATPSVSSLLEQLKKPTPLLTHIENPLNKMDPAEFAKLLAVVEYLKGKPYPPTEPPEWMNHMQKDEWWEGYYRDNPDKKAQLDQRVAAQLQAPPYFQPSPPPMLSVHYQQQPMVPAIQNPFPPPAAQQYAAPQEDVTAQVQSYLAAYQLGNQNATSQAPAPQAFDYNAWAAQQATAVQAQAQTQPPPPFHQPYEYEAQPPQQQQGKRWEANEWESNERDHNAGGSGRGESGRGGKKNKRGGGAKYEGKNPTDNMFDENGNYKGRKRPCAFWLEGKCMKGSKCTFLHEIPEGWTG